MTKQNRPDILSIKKPDNTVVYFLADLHIHTPQEDKYKNLIRFLKTLGPKDFLILGGDIFHVFVGPSDFFFSKFKDFFQVLKNSSFDWIYLSGNHDFHFGKKIEEMGGIYSDMPVEISIKDKKILATHGDDIDVSDINYFKLKKFLHSSFAKFLIHRLPGSLLEKIGIRLGSFSKDSRQRKEHLAVPADEKKRLEEMTRQYASQWGGARGVNLVFSGHTHIPIHEVYQEILILNPGFPEDNKNHRIMRYENDLSGEISLSKFTP